MPVLTTAAYRGTRLPLPIRTAGRANVSTLQSNRKAALLQKIKDDNPDGTGQRIPQEDGQALPQVQEEPDQSSMSDFVDGLSHLYECLSSSKQCFFLRIGW
jgi:hypothetical protein